jgi:hypothetical protein
MKKGAGLLPFFIVLLAQAGYKQQFRVCNEDKNAEGRNSAARNRNKKK